MNERYKELVLQLCRQVEDTYKRIVTPFYHFFGKDKVDLQYNTDVEKYYNGFLEYYYMDSLFPDLLTDKKTHCKFYEASEESQNEIIRILEEMVAGEIGGKHSRTYYYIIDILNMIGATILVYFPEVRVTNENDKYTDIQDLYAKVGITYEGKLRSNFTLNRTTYTVKQLQSDYLHSHVMGIGRSTEELREFKSPCLGHGPIRMTCERLMSCQCDEVMWQLFCVELDRYVHVESKEGVPYKYLENIGSRSSGDDEINIIHVNFFYTRRILTVKHIREFAEYLIDSKKLKFNYLNGSYSLGMSTLQYMIMASNLFIEWYNECLRRYKQVPNKEDLFAKNVLIRVTVVNGRVYKDIGNNNIESYRSHIGETILTFKGRDVPFRIIDFGKEEQQNGFVMLSPKIAIGILNIILQVLNYRYGKEKAKGGPVSNQSTDSEPFYGTTIKTDVKYI